MSIDTPQKQRSVRILKFVARSFDRVRVDQRRSAPRTAVAFEVTCSNISRTRASAARGWSVFAGRSSPPSAADKSTSKWNGCRRFDLRGRRSGVHYLCVDGSRIIEPQVKKIFNNFSCFKAAVMSILQSVFFKPNLAIES